MKRTLTSLLLRLTVHRLVLSLVTFFVAVGFLYVIEGLAYLPGLSAVTILLWSCGILLLWAGLLLGLSPLSELLAFIPVVGVLVNGALAFFTFGISLGVSAMVILFSFFVHSLWVLAFLGVVLAIILAFVFQRIRA